MSVKYYQNIDFAHGGKEYYIAIGKPNIIGWPICITRHGETLPEMNVIYNKTVGGCETLAEAVDYALTRALGEHVEDLAENICIIANIPLEHEHE